MVAESDFIYSCLTFLGSKYIRYFTKGINVKRPEGLIIKTSDKAFIKIFKEEFNKMDSDEKKMIKYEFVVLQPGWWKKNYSRSSFYRCKRKHSLKFIEQLLNRNAILIKD